MNQKITKKLVLVLIISTSVTEDNEKIILVSAKELEQIIYIQYPIAFLGGITQDCLILDSVLALFDSSNEVNIIHLTFAKKLGLVM